MRDEKLDPHIIINNDGTEQYASSNSHKIRLKKYKEEICNPKTEEQKVSHLIEYDTLKLHKKRI